jgi:putative ABC transport system substrate-binding protein
MKRRSVIGALLGAAIAAPAAALAQPQPGLRRVGILMSTAESDPLEASSVAAFVRSLGELGWIEGRNVAIAYRWSAGDAARMEANARELVALAPDVLLVKGGAVPAARRATSAIPIVFVVLSDAVALGLIAGFSRPGGTVTGFVSSERTLVGKRLELLREMVPDVARVLYVRSRRTGTDTDSLLQRAVDDAAAFGIVVVDGPGESDGDIRRAVEAFAGAPHGGMVVAFDAFTTVNRALIADLAGRHRLPAIYPFSFFVRSGGLFSYGFDQDDQFRSAASYVDRILRGESPGELPVQQPTRFELVIDLRTARALALAVPAGLLARADEVIE